MKRLQGAAVRVDLSGQRELAGAFFPAEFYERIDRPVNLDARRWQLLGFDANRGYRAAAPARTR